LCEICARKAWGKGLGVEVWDAWKDRAQDKERRWAEKWSVDLSNKVEGLEVEVSRRAVDSVSDRRTPSKQEKGKGKNRDTVPDVLVEATPAEGLRSVLKQAEPSADALFVFACGHTCHRLCLDKVFRDKEGGGAEHDEHGRRTYKCPICHE